ncbi:MAG TPA: hypothetical protein VEA18_01060 [Candidatus Kapabacteria bacterium]|nr:hypothetical protein [Candidatus Kapabacteria bacterium]
MTELERTALTTLAYFDAFDRPLTKEELYRWLWKGDEVMSFSSFVDQMGTMSLPTTAGYHHLPGREDIVQTHQARVWLTEQKYRVAKRAARKMRYLPFVRAVFVCNTVAMGCPKEESDIDVFIVVKEGRLWVTRLLVTIWLSLWRLRRSKRHIADRVCLSFYHTDKTVDLSSIQLFPDDIYLIYWIDQLLPLYDPDHLAKQVREENSWIRQWIPLSQTSPGVTSRWSIQDTGLSRTLRSVGTFFLSGPVGMFCEQVSKQAQQWKMRRNTKSIQSEPDTRVIINDTMLKFHENDRRTLYRDAWLKRLRDLHLV